MSLNIEKRNQVQKEASFLEKLGYMKTEDDYSINFSLNNYFISVCFPPNSEGSDISIRFLDSNQVFSIGWIALVRDNMEGESEKVKNAIKLLSYVKANYDMITDYQYCLQSNVLIDEYVEQHRTQFEKSVANFLEST